MGFGTRNWSPLHAILDVDAALGAGWQPLDLGRALLDGGARLIQVRAKQLPGAPFLELCDAVVSFARSSGAAVVVNDRANLASMSGAAGVHLGQDDLPVASARALLGADALIGFSTHSIAQVEMGLREAISYIAVGPVFGTRSKETGYDAVGLDLVASAAHLVERTAVVAIGGITLDNAARVIGAGATSVAVLSDLLVGGDPASRVAAYLRALT